jgi:predicted thioesterase
MITLNIKGTREITVTPDQTASAFHSGTLPVFATPCMIALMEEVAMDSVRDELPKGQSTVGTIVNVKHLAPTKVGAVVKCNTELIEIDRRRLVFTVKAESNGILIGEGIHERFIVDIDKFMQKVGL